MPKSAASAYDAPEHLRDGGAGQTDGARESVPQYAKGPVRICFVGPLPPPVHGMAGVNAAVVGILRERACVFALRVSPIHPRRGLVHHVTKSVRALAALAAILAARLRGARTLYGSVDDGLGGIWTTCFAAAGRIAAFRVFLHHHSFRYIDTTTWQMRLLTSVAGPNCRHIFLSDGMAERFLERYPAAAEAIVVPNAIPVPVGAAKLREGDGLVIGMLANLTFEKGLREFVEIVRAARAAGAPVCGILAGPAANVESEQFLEEALKADPDGLSWVGAVSGESKEAFFASIDQFVFPTRYRSEAYPLVLLESLVRGRPVLAPARGCIPVLKDLESALIIDLDVDFVAAAVEQVVALAGQTDLRPLRMATAEREGRDLNRANGAALESLVATLLE
jgi:glycosyltransferase involved in cell wall biosynthesis